MVLGCEKELFFLSIFASSLALASHFMEALRFIHGLME